MPILVLQTVLYRSPKTVTHTSNLSPPRARPGHPGLSLEDQFQDGVSEPRVESGRMFYPEQEHRQGPLRECTHTDHETQKLYL